MIRRGAGLMMLLPVVVWAGQLSAVAQIWNGTQSLIGQLDPWSRSELALSRTPLPRGFTTKSTAARDFINALARERPKAITLFEGIRNYAGSISLEEANTFKGFTYEQDVLRRWNSKRGPMRYRLAAVGDRVADILERNVRTGRIRKLQLYSGGNPRAALQKMLFSDRAADKFVLPRDCYSRIKEAIKQSEGLWSRLQSGRLGSEAGRARIDAQLSQAGLRFDPKTAEVYMQSAKYGRAVLGRLETNEINRALNRLVRDKVTSEQILRRQWRGLVELDPELGALAKRLGGTSHAIRGLYLMYTDLLHEMKQTGEPLHQRGRLTSNLMREMAKARNERYGQLVRRAAAAGVPHDEIIRVVRDAQTDGGNPIRIADNINSQLERRVRQVQRANQLRGHSVLAAFSIVGGSISFALSDQDLLQWVQSDAAAEWGVRSTAGFAGVQLAARLETLLVERTLSNAANTSTKPQLRQVVGRRVMSTGAAAAVFVVGESLIAVMFHDATLAEVADRAYEAVVIFAVSRGAVFAAESAVSAFGGGSLGGPVVAAVALGSAILYESAKYVLNTRSEFNSHRDIFAARCEVAREKVNERFSHLVSQIQAVPPDH